MEAYIFEKRWKGLNKGEKDINNVKNFCNQISQSFLDNYYYRNEYQEDFISYLCELATDKNKDIAKIASKSLFGTIIESLCDDFEELQVETYNRVMSQIISYYIKLPEGKELKDKLEYFNLKTFDEIFARAEDLRINCYNKFIFDNEIKKFIILSRVTIGADVSILSIIIQKLIDFFPNAEIIILGSSVVKDLFGGNKKVKVRELNYTRRGSLIEKLSVWNKVLKIIEDEKKDDPKWKHTIIIDPDSRISQLGVLPLCPSENYLFFNTRTTEKDNGRLSISALTNMWFDSVFHDFYFFYDKKYINPYPENKVKSSFVYPNLWIYEEHKERANNFMMHLKKSNKEIKNFIGINYAVGGNERKRVNKDNFELKLILKLLEIPNTVIILDKGFGEEENKRAEELLKEIKSKKYNVKEVDFKPNSKEVPEITSKISHGVIGVRANIGISAGILSHCNEYIGYDSAFQHIAAALGVPTITIFAGSNNPKFIRRWKAISKVDSDIVHVDTLTKREIDIDNVIERILLLHNKFIKKS